ncbi:MAG: hypothetical protein COA84_13030 [Robiginitomaculum sp.]|nr:MAG: hypothetical protein COA84_13030 [Robiginitomaculum sp.]
MAMKKYHSILARCLANENIRILTGKYHTAHFNMKLRTLAMPTWKDMGDDLYEMLVGHEIGHALFTPAAGWDQCQKDYPEVPASFFNVIEDIRIERMVLDRYPGMIGPFLRGYEEMMAKDMFGIAKPGKIEKLTFIDKINIKGKLRTLIDIKFTDREMVFLEQLSKNKTFEDVVKTSVDIYYEFYNNKSTNIDLESFIDETDDEAGEPALDDVYSDQGERTTSLSDDELPDVDSTCSAVTYEMQEEKLRLSVLIDEDSLYVDDIRPGELEKILIPHSTLAMSRFNKNVVPLKMHIRQAKKTVNQMMKEFNLRKAAHALSRARISDTGTLDVGKIHKYRFDDDLFKQMTSVPQGQSHGIVMLIDYSHSMNRILDDVKYQAGILSMFCKQAQIPFTVYGFTDGGHHGYLDSRGDRDAEARITYRSMRMFELINSHLDRTDYNTALTYLISPTSVINSSIETTGTTPLGEALLLINRVVHKMKSELNLDKMTLVTLTDGQGSAISTVDGKDSPRSSGHSLLSIRMNNKVVTTRRSGMFPAIIKHIRSCGITTVGYHVVTNLISRTAAYPSHTNLARKSGILIGENYKGYDRHFVLEGRGLKKSGSFDLFYGGSKVIATEFKQFTNESAASRVLARKVMEVVG